MFGKLKWLLAGTLRRQLTAGMGISVALIMTLFVLDMTRRQEAQAMGQQSEQAIALARGAATSAAVWVASRDYSGLQEIVDGIAHYPSLRHAIVLDTRGQVLAHSDHARRGLYMTDLPQGAELVVLQRTNRLIDVASPVILGGSSIGWVRIGLAGNALDAELATVRRNGVYYALSAITLSVLFAALAGRYLTRRLETIQRVADAVQAGEPGLRAQVSGDDEAARLARQFNSMLDSLAHQQEALQESAKLFRSMTDTSPLAIYMSFGLEQRAGYINPSFTKLFGYKIEEVPSIAEWWPLAYPDEAYRMQVMEAWQRNAAHAIETHSIIEPMDLVVSCKDGSKKDISWSFVSIGHQNWAFGLDFTERKAAADKIEHLAFYDPLTDLPNRRLLLDRLQRALTSSTRHHRYGALMLLDMDDFKTLNDTLGHDVGDRFLIEVAHRLQACVREGDTVARQGGDEFVVILEHFNEDTLAAMQAESVAMKIHRAISQPYLLDLSLPGGMAQTRNYHCTSSIGITLFRESAISVDELMKRADTAMYQAKAAGRNTLRFFDPEMQAAVTARATLDNDLREAVLGNQFLLQYQPQVDGAGCVTGAEALLRWRHPRRGIVSPAEFIALAEVTGLILPIGHWVLETVCAQLVTWAAMPDRTHLTLAVNVSARQFRHPDFVDQVLAVLDNTGANPQKLKLELTESLLLDDVEDIIAKMTTLKAEGVGFSLDDFGTGYSSLSYLKRLPLDQLKIDQSFVRNVLTDPNDAAIARTIVALAQSMGLGVIAEGVETPAQREFLAANGCHAYQGFFFGRPVPAEEFDLFMPENAVTLALS